ncbi:hypothetical protein QP968_00535 [Corynebacterium sp. MSK041]|nr:hypothetical protein [Corynebacterium sp. MSK041]MDK8794199.1 hypothetical protein [Corynebacterium sp. MSK041]
MCALSTCTPTQNNPPHPERNIIMNIEIIELIASALNVITWILLALSL